MIDDNKSKYNDCFRSLLFSFEYNRDKSIEKINREKNPSPDEFFGIVPDYLAIITTQVLVWFGLYRLFSFISTAN